MRRTLEVLFCLFVCKNETCRFFTFCKICQFYDMFSIFFYFFTLNISDIWFTMMVVALIQGVFNVSIHNHLYAHWVTTLSLFGPWNTHVISTMQRSGLLHLFIRLSKFIHFCVQVYLGKHNNRKSKTFLRPML